MNGRVAAIAPSVTLGMTARANALKAAGRSICSFGAGEPDFDTPQTIKDAAIAALQRGETKYAPSDGLLTLRTAIAEKLRCENGLAYDPGQVVVSNGAKHSLFNIIMAICDEGSEIIIPSPYWLSYPEMVRVAGGRCVFVEGAEENDFKITPAQLESAITSRACAVILNSPSNPTGVVYTGDELRALAEVAVQRGLFVIADEIYEKLVYDGATHFSVGSFSPAILARTITVNGFSKSAAMTGWRLGYMAGPKDVVSAVSALQSHSTSGPNTFAMYGAVEALRNGIPGLPDMVQSFAERRDYIYHRLTAMPGVTCVKPQGAFYVLPNIARCGMDSVRFSERLLEEAGVAVVPGVSFGVDQTVRLSYACSQDNIREGMDRMDRFLKTC